MWSCKQLFQRHGGIWNFGVYVIHKIINSSTCRFLKSSPLSLSCRFSLIQIKRSSLVYGRVCKWIYGWTITNRSRVTRVSSSSRHGEVSNLHVLERDDIQRCWSYWFNLIPDNTLYTKQIALNLLRWVTSLHCRLATISYWVISVKQLAVGACFYDFFWFIFLVWFVNMVRPVHTVEEMRPRVHVTINMHFPAMRFISRVREECEN
jgi:hypothetical protein